MEKKDIRDQIEVVKKVTKTLVFDKFNIPFDVEIYNPSDPLFLNYDLNFNVGIDVDRYLQNDKEYSKFINGLYIKVYKSLRYINLSEKMGGMDFYTYNDNETEKKIQQLNNLINKELKEEYELTDEEIKKVNANYVLKTRALNGSVQFTLFCYGYNNPNVYVSEKTRDKLSCGDLRDLMIESYYKTDFIKNKSYLHLHVDSQICK
jgi:hypothetical protein